MAQHESYETSRINADYRCPVLNQLEMSDFLSSKHSINQTIFVSTSVPFFSAL